MMEDKAQRIECMKKWAADSRARWLDVTTMEERMQQEDEITGHGIVAGIEAGIEEKARTYANPITGQGAPSKALPPTGLRRKPNAKEQHVDFAAINRDLDRLEAKMLESLLPVFRKIRADLITSVQKKFKLEIAYVNALESVRGTTKLGEPFLSAVTAAFDDGGKSFDRDVTALKKMQKPTKPNYKPKDAIAYLKGKSDFFVTGINSWLTQETKKALLHAIDVGEPVRDTIRSLQDIFEPFVGNPNVIRDTEQVTPYRLETIVRTNITDAFNRGRIIASERSGDWFVGFEYAAILDMKTTEVCRFLDGYVFASGDSWLEYLKPPRHYNCRSILVPVMVDTKVDEEDFITDEVAGQALEMSGEGFHEKDDAHLYGECLTKHFAAVSSDPPKREHRPLGSALTLTETKQRAYDGTAKELKTTLDKLATGEIGERIVLALLQKTDTNVAILNGNGNGNNNPVDLISDQSAVEVKTGLASNGASAQHWRSTLGEPGPTEAAKLADMTPEDRAAWNNARAKLALDRKRAFIQMWRRANGVPVIPLTFGVILDPDAQVADVYKFADFHARIGWNSDQAQAAYIGSFRYV